MTLDKDDPIYPISVAAKLLNISAETLRTYEEEDLIKPHRLKGGKRMYSQNDIDWISCIKDLIRKEKLSIKCIKLLLNVLSCYEIKDCPEKIRKNCLAIKEIKCWELMKKACRQLDCTKCDIYKKNFKQ